MYIKECYCGVASQKHFWMCREFWLQTNEGQLGNEFRNLGGKRVSNRS